VFFISIKPVLSDRLPYVTIFHCSLALCTISMSFIMRKMQTVTSAPQLLKSAAKDIKTPQSTYHQFVLAEALSCGCSKDESL
jgi:hypothetical protein